MEKIIAKVAKSLRARGIDAHVAKDRVETREIILDLIPETAIVCIGDS